jgi:hypothetical protein
LLKNSPYGAFQRAYPRSTSTLRDLVQKESETFANVSSDVLFLRQGLNAIRTGIAG